MLTYELSRPTDIVLVILQLLGLWLLHCWLQLVVVVSLT